MPLPIREPRWLPRARSFKGLREIRGKSHAPAILSFFRDAGFPGIRQDEVPWCAAFANAVLAREGLAGTRSLLARSFLGWGEALDGPAIGALCVLRRGTSAWQGHVGFVVGWDEAAVQLLGGNQSDSVSIERYSRARVLGFRWPRGEAQPQAGSALAATTKVALNLRDLPRPAAGRIRRVLAPGTPLDIVETWHRVHAEGSEGWVSARYVAMPARSTSDPVEVSR